MSRILIVVALAALWIFAVSAWSDLPAQIPTHFDLSGNPDVWQEPSFGSWFFLPTLATVLGSLVGLALPALVAGMARRNSKMLNMPQRDKFRALPEDARVRAVRSIGGSLEWLSLSLVALFSWILYGTNEIARGAWQQMPAFGLFGFIGLVFAQAIWLAVASSRAVTRELEAAA